MDSFYKSLRSPTDPKSFLLNEKLNTVRTWNEGTSIVNVIIESSDMMKKNFPFSKSKTTSNSSYGQGNSVYSNLNIGMEYWESKSMAKYEQ